MALQRYAPLYHPWLWWSMSWRWVPWTCRVTWFCHHLIAKPGNKTVAPLLPDPSLFFNSDRIEVQGSNFESKGDKLFGMKQAWGIRRIIHNKQTKLSSERYHIHWNVNIILIKFSSLAALECYHFDEIFVTGYPKSCYNDNFWCSQWQKFRQNNISLLVMLSKFCTLTYERTERRTDQTRASPGIWKRSLYIWYKIIINIFYASDTQCVIHICIEYENINVITQEGSWINA